MPLRSFLVLLGFAWSLGACTDEPAPGADAGIRDAGADLVVDAPLADAAPDSSDATPDTTDAATDASEGGAAGSSCGAPAPRGGCVWGTEYGCCGDNASISPVCQQGAWVCPSGSIKPGTCCGIVGGDGLCGRFSTHPQCDRLFGDAGVIRP
jgi:hypothetical protein